MIGYEGSKWIAYFWFVGWDHLSLGVHFCPDNFELHLPFGFIRVGRRSDPVKAKFYIGRRDPEGWSLRRNINMGAAE